MSQVATYTLCGLIAYLLGAVPFGFLVAATRGMDIRNLGSGNIGATNVFRCVGKGWGILTFVCDFLKGFTAAFFLPVIAAAVLHPPGTQGLGLLCACLAVIGHNWPVYLRFKGGKGIATSAGALLGIVPGVSGMATAVVVATVVWLLSFLVSRYVSLASVLAAVALAVSSWWLRADGDVLTPSAMTGLAVLAVWRHKSNIRRLLNGTENRFAFGKKKADHAG